MNMPGPEIVALACGPSTYDTLPPYSPGIALPEYPFRNVGASRNDAYLTVRESLRLLDLDRAHFGTADWNPLGGVIRPGDKVVLKPNFVREFRETHPGHGDCLITHGSVIRAVLDYVYIALRGRGRIVIADAPHSDADFAAISAITGLGEIQAFYREQGFALEVYDLRPERAIKVNGIIVGHTPLPGDPEGYATVDLGVHSMFHEIDHLCHRLYGSEYDMGELHRHHRDGRHEYLIARTILTADVVLGLPKLKTHKKTGITVNLKNLVGINGNKNWLPHHREGTPSEGGDQFPTDGLKNRLERRVVRAFKVVFPALGSWRGALARPVKAIGKAAFGDTNTGRIRSGNWHGNDTTWRTAIDLNRILFYADAEGRLHDRPVRRFFSVVDGIIGGEGNGPLDPTPRTAGVILAGRNPVAVDLAAARVMGFDFQRLPIIRRSADRSTYPLVSFDLSEVKIRSNREEFNGPGHELSPGVPAFNPHFGWKGHIELPSR